MDTATALVVVDVGRDVDELLLEVDVVTTTSVALLLLAEAAGSLVGKGCVGAAAVLAVGVPGTATQYQ